MEAGQARQNELRSRDNLLQASAQFERQQDAFRIFIGLPPAVPVTFDMGELDRLAELDLSPVEIDDATATAYALGARLDHLNVIDRSEDSARKVVVAEDALRAGLSVAAEWRNASEPDSPGTLDFDDSTWTLAAVLDLPIDQLPERNAYREALIQREVSRRAAEQSADLISAELRDELRDTRSRLESWVIQKNAVELAARRIQSIDLKMQAGRADTRDLLEAQEALLQAKNSASASLIDYNLSRLALFLDMELLRVDENGFHVEELSTATPSDGSPGAADPPQADAGGQDGSPAEPEKVGA
jgi:outer membrane protein TolC